MKFTFKQLSVLAGWLVFGIAAIVYYFSAERSGSLWDCGEFILGAFKLQVVHPPGAPLFLLLGRLFAGIGDLFSNNPADIAFAVNIMSGLATAGAAMFVGWITMILSKLCFVGHDEASTMTQPQTIVSVLAGIAAGLSTAFASSVWFSAVEGEVYALSTFFTAMTFWAAMKWYSLPDEPQHDRWLVFSVYSAGLSIGVHLLSILIFPAVALLYYFKKYEKTSFIGIVAAAGIGAISIGLLQILIITGIPQLWAGLEIFAVNTLGLPFNSGLIPLLLIIGGVIYFGFRYAERKNMALLQTIFVAMTLIVISYSMIGVVVLRASADTPINMNNPSDPVRLIPYLNREQYGERPLIRGPHFDAQPVATDIKDRYGRVDGRYEIVDYKLSAKYADSDKMLFPRMGHSDATRKQLYRIWMNRRNGPPTMADNLEFFFRYQIGWMYWRYFMWNFSGRQNGNQGYLPENKSDGHWYSGIKFVDQARLYNEQYLPDHMKYDQARNRYYMLPFLFGLIGLFFHARTRSKDFIAVLALFIITGIGIIVYSNQPPNEPRERDYVLVGSIFTYCMWIGLAIPALFNMLMERKLDQSLAIPFASIVLIAPFLMGTQNFDDHSRRNLTGARDYANNFLMSCEPNSIIFTYGDNDTYPLWYAQEVEGIRTDVRVVNLSLIAVDWYINQLRRTINQSPAIKLSIPADGYRGNKRNILYLNNNSPNQRPMSLEAALTYMGESHPVPASSGRTFESSLPSTNLYLNVDRERAMQEWVTEADSSRIVERIPLKIQGRSLSKDELAILDIVHSNIYDRPIYFSVTTKKDKLFGMDDYVSLEGLGMRLVPYRTPSETEYGFVGSGDVDSEKIYDHVMNDFKWGGFDEHNLYVTSSFLPSYYAHKQVILRAAYDLVKEGKMDKAVDLANKYFEGFPNENFLFDQSTLNFLNIYDAAGQLDQAKEHMRTLANVTFQQLRFFDSVDQNTLENSFASERNQYRAIVPQLKRLANKLDDPEFMNQINAFLDPVSSQEIPN